MCVLGTQRFWYIYTLKILEQAQLHSQMNWSIMRKPSSLETAGVSIRLFCAEEKVRPAKKLKISMLLNWKETKESKHHFSDVFTLPFSCTVNFSLYYIQKATEFCHIICCIISSELREKNKKCLDMFKGQIFALCK